MTCAPFPGRPRKVIDSTIATPRPMRTRASETGRIAVDHGGRVEAEAGKHIVDPHAQAEGVYQSDKPVSGKVFGGDDDLPGERMIFRHHGHARHFPTGCKQGRRR